MHTPRQPAKERNALAVSLTTDRARRLRREQTGAEQILWERLRAQRLNGLTIRRQFPIGPYIADFCCKEYRLLVELDGGQHAEGSAAASDARRSEILKQYGYRVIRFWNNEVITNIDGVLEIIIEATRGA